MGVAGLGVEGGPTERKEPAPHTQLDSDSHITAAAAEETGVPGCKAEVTGCRQEGVVGEGGGVTADKVEDVEDQTGHGVLPVPVTMTMPTGSPVADDTIAEVMEVRSANQNES